MPHDDVEWNRPSFEPARLLAARAASWAILEEAFALLKAGMRSHEARALVDAHIVARTGTRPWHPTQLRADHETRLPFGRASENAAVLTEQSLVFVDMGPLVDGYEGDVALTRRLDGRPDPLALAATALHDDLVRDWKLHRPTGRALYTHAAERAAALGYRLAVEGASGHRLADHPHAVRARLRAFDRVPRACAWVLEVHLLDDTRGLGAFYEDLLV